MSLKMQSMILFWAPCSHLGFLSLVCPLTTIAWNLGIFGFLKDDILACVETWD
jgi:hypothetical protein